MVWSSEDRNMPSISPTMTVMVCRCVRASPGAGPAVVLDMGAPGSRERGIALIVAFSNYVTCCFVPPEHPSLLRAGHFLAFDDDAVRVTPDRGAAADGHAVDQHVHIGLTSTGLG